MISQYSMLFTIVLFITALGLVLLKSQCKQVWAPPKKNDAAHASFLSPSFPVLKLRAAFNCHATATSAARATTATAHNECETGNTAGKIGQKCETCHQQENVADLICRRERPTGTCTRQYADDWEGKSRQICRQIERSEQNNANASADHRTRYAKTCTVVGALAKGRTLPPMGHDEFARRFQDWARTAPPARQVRP